MKFIKINKFKYHMRICCVEIDKNSGISKQMEFNCAQTGKSSIKDLIVNSLVKFLGGDSGCYGITTSAYHVCAISADGTKIGIANPVKSTTKLTDSLREYDKDWSAVDSHLKSLHTEELTSSEILKEMRKIWPDFTLTNVYYRLRVNKLTYKKSPRGKRRNHYSL